VTRVGALEWESRYYALAIRVATALAIFFLLASFVLLPREFVVQPYQLRRDVVTIMEALPPEIEKFAEPPKVEKPQMPVAAASEEEVEATTIETTTFSEIVRRTEETSIPVVPFWKVEVKPQPISIPTPTYPEMARNAGIEGQVVVKALVDITGDIIEAEVLKSSGNSTLDAAAVSASYSAKFTPAKQRDQPVRVYVSIPYRFSLQ